MGSEEAGHASALRVSTLLCWDSVTDEDLDDPSDGPGVVDVALDDDEINRGADRDSNARCQKALARLARRGRPARGVPQERGRPHGRVTSACPSDFGMAERLRIPIPE
ncbi:hypothetical protein AB0B50_03270 [Streptomyces sp. NPDC041068]|uniref:hypothetical protein n=1 Tax=Streptomyces sp. NPDC041068 TaxID=3155130 RepID=UPI0033D27CF0